MSAQITLCECLYKALKINKTKLSDRTTAKQLKQITQKGYKVYTKLQRPFERDTQLTLESAIKLAQTAANKISNKYMEKAYREKGQSALNAEEKHNCIEVMNLINSFDAIINPPTALETSELNDAIQSIQQSNAEATPMEVDDEQNNQQNNQDQILMLNLSKIIQSSKEEAIKITRQSAQQINTTTKECTSDIGMSTDNSTTQPANQINTAEQNAAQPVESNPTTQPSTNQTSTIPQSTNLSLNNSTMQTQPDTTHPLNTATNNPTTQQVDARALDQEFSNILSAAENTNQPDNSNISGENIPPKERIVLNINKKKLKKKEKKEKNREPLHRAVKELMINTTTITKPTIDNQTDQLSTNEKAMIANYLRALADSVHPNTETTPTTNATLTNSQDKHPTSNTASSLSSLIPHKIVSHQTRRSKLMLKFENQVHGSCMKVCKIKELSTALEEDKDMVLSYLEEIKGKKSSSYNSIILNYHDILKNYM